MIEERLKSVIRDVPDFPKPGIRFKDITPILKDPGLCADVVSGLAEPLDKDAIDVVVGIESRGFFFGLLLAQHLGKPFVPVRKAGKLPYRTVQQEYALEYGTATVEIHADAFDAGSRVLIHDDLLATGGTVAATSQLVTRLGGLIAGYSFMVSLDFLHGSQRIAAFSSHIHALVSYD